jgi:hypothetical protein
MWFFHFAIVITLFMEQEIELDIADKRMFLLMAYLKKKKVIKYIQEFCEATGCYKQSMHNIKVGRQHFTVEQIRMACKVYKVNANWLLGFPGEPIQRERRLSVVAGGSNKRLNVE